ncbi:MAG: serine hydrolase, partial [Opitutaceae bacterium]
MPQPNAPNGYELVPAERSITIHDLLTHRAGFPGQGGSGGARPAANLRRDTMRSSNADSTLADFVTKLATVPLDNQPGVEWRYGDSTTVLGRVIEVA